MEKVERVINYDPVVLEEKIKEHDNSIRSLHKKKYREMTLFCLSSALMVFLAFLITDIVFLKVFNGILVVINLHNAWVNFKRGREGPLLLELSRTEAMKYHLATDGREVVEHEAWTSGPPRRSVRAFIRSEDNSIIAREFNFEIVKDENVKELTLDIGNERIYVPAQT